jgi:hypothetical protein
MGAAPTTTSGLAGRLVSHPGHGWILMLSTWLMVRIGLMVWFRLYVWK